MNPIAIMSAELQTLAYRVEELEKDVKILTSKVERLVMGIVALAVSIAGSAVVFALTVLNSP